MKYAVIGIGAIGSVVGGILAKSGEDVIFIGKNDQVEIIKKNGIKIEDLHETIHVKDLKIFDDISKINHSDVIIVCVKSQDTERLANNMKNHLKKEAVIISLQNGVRNSKILNEITEKKVLSGVILFNALYSKPGEVVLTLKGGGLVLESDDSHIDIVSKLVETFDSLGLNSKIDKNIQGYLWSKLIVNLQNPITALTGQTIRDSFLDKDSRKIIVKTMEEGLSILYKSGISHSTLPEIDPKATIRRLSMFNSTLIKLGSRILKLNPTAKTSMLQSISRGRPTEIDFINGEIVTLAKKNNLKAPINTKLVELVKNAEKKKHTENYKPSELRNIIDV